MPLAHVNTDALVHARMIHGFLGQTYRFAPEQQAVAVLVGDI